MKKIFLKTMVAISVSIAPVLIGLVLWDYVFAHFGIMSLAHGTSMGFIVAPILFPFVMIGTVISCRRSVAIRMRPLVITMGIIGIIMSGVVSAYWGYILTAGFMG